MIDSIKQLLQQEAQAVLNIPVTDAYEKAVQLIVEQIHQKKGKLVTSGMGKAHNLDPELKFIVITGNPDSPLANESNVCLSTGKPAEVCTLGMTPTTSTTAMTVIGDILVVQTMKKTEFTIEEYSKRHHGGYLGEKSRSLCEK